MAQYRKKPVVIEAWQVASRTQAPEWLLDACSVGKVTAHPFRADHFNIQTLEGVMLANPGDWIIRGVQGELYPCKPDIFAETYEAVV